MIYPIEELLQIEIDYPVIPRTDIVLSLFHCLMGRASGPEPIAVIAERRIPLPLQFLHHRLLDKAIDYRRDTQQAFAAAGFRDAHSSHRGWAVTAGQQLRFQFRPVVFQVVRQLACAHAVTSRRTFIGFHSFQGLLEIDGFTDGFHQPFC
ncbi:hypothetical protein D3C75_629150 [compost metagenome]